MMELKFQTLIATTSDMNTLNRTMMELKLARQLGCAQYAARP